MKKKVIKTIFCILGGIVLFGLLRIISYQVDVHYSQVAAQQVVDDSAYSILQSHDSVDSIISICYFVVGALIVYLLYSIWLKERKVSQ
jgi:ABC-type antimicrobial peptide transport system permease subunit